MAHSLSVELHGRVDGSSRLVKEDFSPLAGGLRRSRMTEKSDEKELGM